MIRGWRLGGHLGLSSPEAPLLAHLGRSVNPLDQIDALAVHGFSAVQDLFLKLRPGPEQDAMAERMAGAGLVLSSFGGDPQHWNTPMWSAEDAAGHAALHASVALSGTLAARFGGAGAVCVAGLDPDRTVSAQLSAMAENLCRVADEAARWGLVLLVEPIAEQRIAGMLLSRLEQGAEIVRAVAHPAVRLMFDVGHVAMMGHDVPPAIRECADIIGLVQAADLPGRIDLGLGTLDWPAIFAALGAAGYNGIVELEHEPAVPTKVGEAAMLSRLATLL